MGLLQLLRYPSLGTTVGSISKVTNAKESGAQAMTWAYQNQGGVVSNSRTYTNTLRVITSSAFVGPIQIQQFLLGIGVVQGAYYVYNGEGGLPAVATEYDTGSFLHSMTFAQDGEDAKQWKVTFEYGPYDGNHESGSASQNIGVINPLDAVPDIKWTPAVFEEFYPKDINGLPFLNTAGDPIEDPPKRMVSRQTFSFSRNEATYNDSYAQLFRQTVNSSPFLSFEANQVKCSSIDAERHFDADWGYFWRVNYQFEMRVVKFTNRLDGTFVTYGWEDLILNAGFHKLISSTLTPILINGQPTPVPVPLTQDGLPLNTTWSTNNNSNPDPIYLVFMQYAQSDFSQLNIPGTILTDPF